MGVSLYTSRIVLNTLGVEDFGIYNVVGGVVMMLSFLNSSMSTATQRFLSFEIGKNDYGQLKNVFSMSVNIHAIIAVAIFVLAETIGLWFLNAKLNIPVERMVAANWVYQFSVLSFMVTVLSVPYNATIIAHERMNVYAYVSIVEVVLKLAIVFALVWFGYDKLKMYAILIFCVSVIVWVIYRFYCRRNFMESNYSFFWDKSLYKTLMNFAGWNIFGNLAWVMMNQGLNLLLNIFFGPIVNAARGIAFQVNAAVVIFVNNFRIAINPQIIKSFAVGDNEYMKKLVFEGAKYSFYLLLFLTLPMLLETNIILKIWLKIVPDYAVIFCQLVLVSTLIQCFDASFGIVFQAIGKIKENQLMSGGTYLLILPVSYVLLKLNFPPPAVFWVQIAVTIIVAFVIKFYLLTKMFSMRPMDYLEKLILPVLKVSMLAIIMPILVKISMAEGFLRLFLVSCTSIFSVLVTIYYIGMNKETRLKTKNILMTRILKLKL
jgi:O-antigen/teichoic acid export membrane protein